jgi:hypothetical protein
LGSAIACPDIAIERTTNELKQPVGSPNTRLVHEYTALVQREYSETEQFVYNSKIPDEDAGKLYDALKTKYGIDPGEELSSYVSDKMHIIVEAGRRLNICPCYNGTKTHTIPASNHSRQEIYDCETCGGIGRLA